MIQICWETESEKSFRKLLKFAIEGDVKAQFFVGCDYEEKGNYAEAKKWYLKVAESNDKQKIERTDEEIYKVYDARMRIGNLYQEGLGVSQDYEEARKWYLSASEVERGKNDFGEAEEAIGKLRDLCEADWKQMTLEEQATYEKETLEWYTKAVKKKNHNALEAILEKYKGFSVLDEAEFFPYFLEIACVWTKERGIYSDEQRELLCFLAQMYEHGKGVEQNYEEAFRWYKESLKICLGHSDIKQRMKNMCNKVAKFYESDIERNDKETLKWYERAENYYGLAQIYYQQKNYEKAVEFYKKVYGVNEIESRRTLGHMYYNGIGVKQNYEEATKYYGEAALMGDAMSQYYMGEIEQKHSKELKEAPRCFLYSIAGLSGAKKQCYDDIYENPLDDNLYKEDGYYYYSERKKRMFIFRWYKKSAEGGYAPAYYYVGKHLERENIEQAITCYEKAAQSGVLEAQKRLGEIYWEKTPAYANKILREQGSSWAKGTIIENKNNGSYEQKALEYFTMASEQGDMESKYSIGLLYEYGTVIKKNNKEALRYYEEAANGGYYGAKLKLESIKFKILKKLQ